MKNYLKLVNFEVNRFIKVYLSLIGITVVLQLVGTFLKSKSYLKEANWMIYKEGVPVQEFLEMNGYMDLVRVLGSWWFIFPIIICIAVLLIYVFLIWYRDWFGKSTFIYRLLMLPTARINIYLAKATTIFLMVLGLVALQLVLLPIENKMIDVMIPDEFQMALTSKEAISSYHPLSVLFPNYFSDFLIYYGIGFMVVFLIFTAILFERSFQIKGIFYGIIYIAIMMGILVAPIFTVLFTGKSYLYPLELFYLEIILGILVMILSILISRYLLNKKITV